MTGGEYLFYRMAKSFGGQHQSYQSQPIKIREAMEDAYQDIRLKMFGAAGKEWEANAVPSGNNELKALAARLKEDNERLRDENEAFRCRQQPILQISAPEGASGLKAAALDDNRILQGLLSARNAEIASLKAELAIERRERRTAAEVVEAADPDAKPAEPPAAPPVKKKRRGLFQYMSGRAFE